MTAPWNETTFPTLLSNYKLEDTFNADESGLFYQCLPSKTYHLSGENCSGGKNSEVILQENLEQLHELDNDAIQPNLLAESFADL